MNHRLLHTFAAMALMAIPSSLSAIELGAPFSDHAVLQREMPLPVWGWSKPGTEVTVEFAGQKKQTIAGADGKWLLKLDSLAASTEPRDMTITESGGGAHTLKDLLVGEVWMASGQSNMQWLASKSSASVLVSQLKEKGETPPIREFEVTSVYAALHPIERATGAWKVNDYANYSAVAFSFALKVYREIGVPIGILNCSFSQTSIESWVPREGFAAGTDDYTKSIYQKTLETDPTTPEHKKAWDGFYQSLDEAIKTNAALIAAGKEALPVSTTTPGNMRDNRDASWMFNGRLSPVIPYALRGAIWNQGYANIHGGLQYYPNLHSLIRGWRLKWDNPQLPVYFHQFYCPGSHNIAEKTPPSVEPIAEMRLGALLARDIPHTGMASQIDIEGAIHYYQKALPGQRLALHALKNQYGKKDIVTDGPIFKSHSVNGDKLTVEFDHAEGGLVVAETLTNSANKITENCDGLATPKIIPNGESQVNHFWLAGEDRVWHPATVRFDGAKAIVTSPAVKSPRGVSYGTGGIGFRPGLYNKALLPAPPFIYYDNKLVTSETWPDKPMKIAGKEVDLSTVGNVYGYRKLPILRTQFRDNAILQADMPITISGAAVLEWGPEAKGEKIIKFSFAGIEKTIPITPEMKEWSVTVPAMPASKEPKTLHVSMTIAGELVHDRVCKNILIGDVWYVASPSPGKKPAAFQIENSGQPVRVMTRMSKRASADKPARYMISTSTDPNNRFASTWEDAAATDFAAALGHRLAKQSGRPTGIIHMTSEEVPLNSWFKLEHLKNAPSLVADYKNLAQMQPGNEIYDGNVRRYIGAWKSYWEKFIPQMIATRGVPNGEAWGTYPQLAGEVTSKACETHNVCTYSFIPAAFKGVLFLTGPAMFKAEQGENFGSEMTALANGFIEDFGGKAKFIYTLPDKTLTPKITTPVKITGASTAIPISDWNISPELLEKILPATQN